MRKMRGWDMEEQKKKGIWRPILAFPGLTMFGIGGFMLIIGMDILSIAAFGVGTGLLAASRLQKIA